VEQDELKDWRDVLFYLAHGASIMKTLHPVRRLTALVPFYVSKFRCIGSECEDNCCTGWQVSVDKKTYQAYRKLDRPELAPIVSVSVKRQRSQPSDANYARIELKPHSGECPFMDGGLCSVQKELDESYLSDTCFSYPRQTRQFAGQYEQALTLSCPEAARQALLHPDAFQFAETSLDVRVSRVAGVRPKFGLSLELMNELRIFCLQLMRTEGLALWQRLAVLGVFCESLDKALSEHDPSEVRSLIHNFTVMVEQGLVMEALATMQPNHPVQARVFEGFWRAKQGYAASAVHRQVAQAVALGLGAGGDQQTVTAEQLVANYTNGLKRLPEAMQAAPYLLEHYILNEMFREVFPFEGASPYDDYLQLVSRFGLLRLMLAARCNTDGALPDASELVQTVQVFCRRFQHDAAFTAQVRQALKNAGWADLDKVYRFLMA
jgi:lysine-N-methylase